VGANVGYATSVLARRVGRFGRVLTLEAHPELHRELGVNLASWRNALSGIVLEGYDVALSSGRGTARLEVLEEFARNRGLCSVCNDPGPSSSGETYLPVASETLDAFLGGRQRVGVAKMDVEGHEEAVLLGARELFAAGRVRDWVFEHHGEYPSPVTRLFETNGYTVFKLRKKFVRPALVGADRKTQRSAWEPPNYLATQDPGRAASRFGPSGWRCLRGG
jgi:FkbM family methyltransferase